MQKAPDWRIRERAQTLLLIALDNNFQQVAAMRKLRRQTVSSISAGSNRVLGGWRIVRTAGR